MVESMPGATISFPMLGEGFSINPSSSFSILGLPLHWYGLIIAVGFLLAVVYTMRRSPDFGLTEDNIIDMLLFAVPLAVIGARLYYVIFNFSLYRENLSDIFKTWNGGLAIYGAVIGAVLGLLLYGRVKKTSIAPYMDVGALGLLIGQLIGRWGNFINREAFGRETEIFCRMGLTDAAGNTIYVHPTFLYESLWNLLGFILLHFFSKSKKYRYNGQIFAMYVAWYGFGRMLIEGLRTDSLYLFQTGLRVSQVLGGLTALLALAYLAYQGSVAHGDRLPLTAPVAHEHAHAEEPAHPPEAKSEPIENEETKS